MRTIMKSVANALLFMDAVSDRISNQLIDIPESEGLPHGHAPVDERIQDDLTLIQETIREALDDLCKMDPAYVGLIAEINAEARDRATARMALEKLDNILNFSPRSEH